MLYGVMLIITSITIFNRKYNINGVRLDCRQHLESSQQRYISQTEGFRTKNALDV